MIINIITRTRGTLYTVYSPIGEIYSDSYDKGAINRSLFCFKPDAALYMQTLIRKKLEDVTDQDDIWVIPNVTYTTSSGSSSYYNPYSYYDPYSYYGYGYSPYSYGGYGYSPYGYGGYGYGYGSSYSNYYNYAMMAQYYGSSSTSTSSKSQLDRDRYYYCRLYGPEASDESLRPQLSFTYSVPND